MTSAAVCWEKPSERVSRVAVPSSSVPASADRLTRKASSVFERPLVSSSRGSMPALRRILLALPLSTKISGVTAQVKPRCSGTDQRAVAIGTEIARFLGTSSPSSIDTMVARNMPRPIDTGSTAPSGIPTPVSGPSSRRDSDGSTRYPTSRVVSVMPTCAPDSWVDSVRRPLRTEPAERLPEAASRSTSGRSRVMRENSAATNTPVPRVSRPPSASSSHSVSTAHPSPGTGGATFVAVRGPAAGWYSRGRSSCPDRTHHPAGSGRPSSYPAALWTPTTARSCSSARLRAPA